jgi:secreted Zn-dependent insulinase-like peptidase
MTLTPAFVFAGHVVPFQVCQDDAVRRSAVLSHLTHSSHPYHRFGWGNAASLLDTPAKAEIDMQVSQ